jgi:hypothetical protein
MDPCEPDHTVDDGAGHEYQPWPTPLLARAGIEDRIDARGVHEEDVAGIEHDE